METLKHLLQIATLEALPEVIQTMVIREHIINSAAGNKSFAEAQR